MSVLSDRLAALTGRERVTLVAGGIAALAIVLYTAAWRPWQDELERLRAQVPRKAESLQWMRAQSARIESLIERSERRPEGSGLPLLTLIERSANRLDIREAITRMSPGDEADQVRIWMDDADFDQWLRWLEMLNDSGVEVAEASIDRAEENRVNIRTTLQR